MSSNEAVREGVLEEEGDVEEDLAETKVARATELRTEAVAAFKEYRNYNRMDLCAKGGWLSIFQEHWEEGFRSQSFLEHLLPLTSLQVSVKY